MLRKMQFRPTASLEGFLSKCCNFDFETVRLAHSGRLPTNLQDRHQQDSSAVPACTHRAPLRQHRQEARQVLEYCTSPVCSIIN